MWCRIALPPWVMPSLPVNSLQCLRACLASPSWNIHHIQCNWSDLHQTYLLRTSSWSLEPPIWWTTNLIRSLDFFKWSNKFFCSMICNFLKLCMSCFLTFRTYIHFSKLLDILWSQGVELHLSPNFQTDNTDQQTHKLLLKSILSMRDRTVSSLLSEHPAALHSQWDCSTTRPSTPTSKQTVSKTDVQIIDLT